MSDGAKLGVMLAIAAMAFWFIVPWLRSMGKARGLQRGDHKVKAQVTSKQELGVFDHEGKMTGTRCVVSYDFEAVRGDGITVHIDVQDREVADKATLLEIREPIETVYYDEHNPEKCMLAPCMEREGRGDGRHCGNAFIAATVWVSLVIVAPLVEVSISGLPVIPCLSAAPILFGLAIGALAHFVIIVKKCTEKDVTVKTRGGNGFVNTCELGHEGERSPRFLGECSDTEYEDSE
eukprot:gnl/MRDRNA2_/MRDRNA2_82707_c0_seq1.p1 gnl/MRDRNA2_/MRDRNA2_82707_c0~~gnl/MRDRNA2_/MRDRNA2_82707_c0_seq1.p1  ORF type:complete len:265 (-),score=17.05 gnl/MRDRNA2_/MRDRNA2_82707_c0_seq1:99-803(-)